ncbi:hypothetical protein [Ferrimicrobium sp.]|uniref:hypothetical protein n=1 Tax=Ferrimicrobium sp. TaxID=2926050 RepID=UPI00263000C9|nr:hypothetical protein [Ferrimicrobium sp.]
MAGKKSVSFKGKQVDLDTFANKIEEYLKSDGFTVESAGDADKGYVVQAKKGGFLSEVISAQRALIISLSGPSDDVTLTIGVGNWKKELAVTAIETLLVSDLFLPVDIAEMAWTAEVENKILKQIETMV